MTLLTVDAKLMPILPLIARPESERALVVAFGMGIGVPDARSIAGLRDRRRRARPVGAEDVRLLLPGRRRRSSPTRTAG